MTRECHYSAIPSPGQATREYIPSLPPSVLRGPFYGFKDPEATAGTPISEPSVLPRDFQIHFTDEAVVQLQAMVTAAEGKSNQQLCSLPWAAEL